jgi:phosphoglycolate phosphatase-like HAD superfamily hydrolase
LHYQKTMRLILFDIDGTLIQGNGAGKAAMVYALETLFGTAGPIASYDMAGKTDPLIIGDLLTAAGITPAEIESKLPAVYELMAQSGRTLFAEKGVRTCAGVVPLLAALAEQPHVCVGLLTGNAEQTAALKLAAAGLDPTQFRAGAYGSDHADRNQLTAIAMWRASDCAGYPFDGANTVVVGDTPADIACARAGGATAVAVASGRYSLASLAQYQPDHLLENLADTAAVLEILTAGQDLTSFGGT